mmetsp:Transcript_69088/g.174172  ORF Transcript_69088/g.174172 Transcript_69088/m.174172 type:complete len:99 (-) Transcript_69088:119-415(-)
MIRWSFTATAGGDATHQQIVGIARMEFSTEIVGITPAIMVVGIGGSLVDGSKEITSGIVVRTLTATILAPLREMTQRLVGSEPMETLGPGLLAVLPKG